MPSSHEELEFLNIQVRSLMVAVALLAKEAKLAPQTVTAFAEKATQGVGEPLRDKVRRNIAGSLASYEAL